MKLEFKHATSCLCFFSELSSYPFLWFTGGIYEVNDGAPPLLTDIKQQNLFDHKFNFTGVTDSVNNLTDVRLESDGEVGMVTGNILVPSPKLQAVAMTSEAVSNLSISM